MRARALMGAIGLGGLVGFSLLLGGGLLAGGISTHGPGPGGLTSAGGHLVSVTGVGFGPSALRGWSHLPLEQHAQALAGHGGALGASAPGAAQTTYVPMKHCDMQAHWAILSGSTVAS